MSLLKVLRIGILGAAALCGQPLGPSSAVVRVPATANPYLAGMPDGARLSWGDSAPKQSPVLVPLSLVGATAVTFTVSGGVNHIPGCPPQCDPLNGAELTSHRDGSEHGISNIFAPFDSLLGVFLDDLRPDRSRAPRTLDFSRIGTNFESISPALKQTFYIGAGANKNGTKRRFLIPKGATRLFLASMDSFEWNNNSGAFHVTVNIERADVSSNMSSVDSKISFANWACLPDRSQCTPGREIVEERGAGHYHVLLPAPMEWGVSIPTPTGANVTITDAIGTVCLDSQSRNQESCNGWRGNGMPAGAGFIVPGEPAGALVTKTAGGKAYFSVNDTSGSAFQKHEGYFEFDVTVK